jgi:phosphotriesterase-related protein
MQVTEVNTAKGRIDTSNMGATLMHEHVFVMSPEIKLEYPGDWDEAIEVADAIRRLRELKQKGIDSLVDLTVIGLGRYIPRIERIAEEVDVNIIVATGLYVMNEVPLYFLQRGPGTALGGPEPMIEMFVQDIETGIGTTRVRAGILKCATGPLGTTPGIERVLRAVAQAHRRTGVPISTHTEGWGGDEQQRIFREEGVDLRRVVIGHCGGSTDLRYLEALMAEGSFIGMDHFGIDSVPSETRVDLVATLCARGYARQMVLSHDANCYTDTWDKSSVNWPNWHYNHISEHVLPALRDRGVTEAQIWQMLVENPRTIFEMQDSY